MTVIVCGLLCKRADDLRAWIDDPILAMAHAHDATFGFEAAIDERARKRRLADFLGHLERRLIGATMQRTEERARSGRESGWSGRERRSHHTRSEGAGVEAVIELQDLYLLEHFDIARRWRAFVEQVQRAFPITFDVRIRGRLPALAHGVDRGDGRG